MFGLSTTSRDAEFTDFARGASGALTRMAYALTGDRDAAQDLVQTALLKTYVSWGRIRPGEAHAYARRIIVNQRIDTWRATRRESLTGQVPERTEGTGSWLGREGHGGPPGASGTDGVDQRDQLVRALQQLPEQQRKVVVLRYYADLSEASVAEMLGISVGAVKSAASRGLTAIRANESAAAQASEAAVTSQRSHSRAVASGAPTTAMGGMR